MNRSKALFLKRIFYRAAKWPALSVLLGTFLVALGYIDDVFPLTQWKHLFDLTDAIGCIFVAFACLQFAYNFLALLLRYNERKLVERHRVASLILASIRKGMRIILVLGTIHLMISFIGPTKSYLMLANDIIKTVIIGSVGWIAIQILYTYEAVIYEQMVVHSNKNHQRVKEWYTTTHILRNSATVVIVLITIAAIFMSFSSVKNIGISLLASAGFLTAIASLSAQKTLYALFSGLQLALSQAVRIGDMVVIDKESGVVEEITFTYIKIKLGDKRRMVVPISYFIERPFENWSHEPQSLQSSIRLYVDYLMPLQPLRNQLNIILKTSPYWDGRAKLLQVAAVTENSVEIRIQLSAANADDLSDLRAEVREKMLDFIKENYADYLPTRRLQAPPFPAIKNEEISWLSHDVQPKQTNQDFHHDQ